jgi:DNA-binding GntR family transcriptional regulator
MYYITFMVDAKTRQEAAAEKIRRAIFDGDYGPGQRLKQQELAQLFGYSAIPVREALHQLAAEGLVILDPQKGARVVELSSKRLEEIYEVRIHLEAWAAGLAVRRMTPETAAHIEAILKKMDRPNITNPEWLTLDLELHDSLYACAEQEALRKTISNLRLSVEPYLRLELAKVVGYAPGRREHRRIFQACLRGDAKAAERHTVAHLRRVAKGLIVYLRRLGR